MSRPFLLCALVLGGLALGQEKKNRLRDEVKDKVMASPGYIQESFLESFQSGLAAEFDVIRARKMFERMLGRKWKARDVLQLVNGRMSKSEMRKRLGATSRQIPGTRRALDLAVLEKDKRLFFGVMLHVMVTQREMDPTSDFCQQACNTVDEVEEKEMERIRNSNFSRQMVGELFGFTHDSDRKEMAKILKLTKASPLLKHPMGASLGLGAGPFDPSRFPRLTRSMTGGGGAYDDGTAGGLPFDSRMPPCPYSGSNIRKYFDGNG